MDEIDHPLWVDTNMSTGDTFFTAAAAAAEMMEFGGGRLLNERDLGNLIAMCGCFKGFTDTKACAHAQHTKKGLLDKQFKFAKQMVECNLLEPFWYIPDVDCQGLLRGEIEDFFYRMREEVHPLAPLRTYILHVKPYTPNHEHKTFWETASFITKDTKERPIDVWQDLCKSTYQPELLWIPSDQVRLPA